MLTSYDSIIAAFAAGNGQYAFCGKQSLSTATGAPSSFWGVAGSPGAGSVAGTAFTAAAASKATAGAIQFMNASGGNDLFLSRMSAITTVSQLGILMLVDRLLYYPGITVGATSPISLTAGASLPRYTTGEGVVPFLEVTAAITQGSGSFSMSYTNQAGTAGRTSETIPYLANLPVGRIANTNSLFCGLQNGDTGVQTVQSITFSSTTSAGSYALVLCKPLATIPLYTSNAGVERDLVLNTPRFPEIKDDACLQWVLWAGNTSTGQLYTDFDLVQG